MTRPEFETFMDVEGWFPEQRDAWSHVTPTCDAATFRREQKRPDGMIEVSLIRRKNPIISFLGIDAA